MALPFFAENGWEVTVATADPSCYSAPVDEALAKTVPGDTRVVALPCWNEAKCRRFGFGHLSNRIVWPWRKAVREILQREHFDLVFFTTTQAMVLANGPYWRKRSGVPYVVDLQDPIYIPGGSYTRKNAPGAYWKYRVSQFFSRFLERAAFACPCGVVATSAHYIETLRQRYPHLQHVPMRLLPFGLPWMDLELAGDLGQSGNVFQRHADERIFLYAGRGGPDLHAAFGALFRAAAELCRRNPALRKTLRFVFVGTSYGPAGSGRRQIAPIAATHGCEDLVEDRPDRVPYFDVLRATGEADCAMVFGARSADYTASKALMTLAAARSIIAIVHRESVVSKLYENHGKAMVCRFEEHPEEPECMKDIVAALSAVAEGTCAAEEQSPIDGGLSARTMTKKLCDLFDLALENSGAAVPGATHRRDSTHRRS